MTRGACFSFQLPPQVEAMIGSWSSFVKSRRNVDYTSFQLPMNHRKKTNASIGLSHLVLNAASINNTPIDGRHLFFIFQFSVKHSGTDHWCAKLIRTRVSARIRKKIYFISRKTLIYSSASAVSSSSSPCCTWPNRCFQRTLSSACSDRSHR